MRATSPTLASRVRRWQAAPNRFRGRVLESGSHAHNDCCARARAVVPDSANVRSGVNLAHARTSAWRCSAAACASERPQSSVSTHTPKAEKSCARGRISWETHSRRDAR
eukprot:6204641-Pleurochrysis_carterae.AAC.2